MTTKVTEDGSQQNIDGTQDREADNYAPSPSSSNTLDELIDGFSDYIYWKLGGTYVTTAERLNRPEFKVAINEYIHAEVEKAVASSGKQWYDRFKEELPKVMSGFTEPVYEAARRASGLTPPAQKDVPPTIQEPKHVSEKASGDTPAQKEENRG